VRCLAAPGDSRAFDAEGPEDDAQREIHRLEDRPLLDVQLEIGARALELLADVKYKYFANESYSQKGPIRAGVDEYMKSKTLPPVFDPKQTDLDVEEVGKRVLVETGNGDKFSPKLKDISPKRSPLWQTDPDQQLGYYARRSWARRHKPSILLGMHDVDELPGKVIEHDPTEVAAVATDCRASLLSADPPNSLSIAYAWDNC
jgi:hypothetical protein